MLTRGAQHPFSFPSGAKESCCDDEGEARGGRICQEARGSHLELLNQVRQAGGQLPVSFLESAHPGLGGDKDNEWDLHSVLSIVQLLPVAGALF